MTRKKKEKITSQLCIFYGLWDADGGVGVVASLNQSKKNTYRPTNPLRHTFYCPSDSTTWDILPRSLAYSTDSSVESLPDSCNGFACTTNNININIYLFINSKYQINEKKNLLKLTYTPRGSSDSITDVVVTDSASGITNGLSQAGSYARDGFAEARSCILGG